VSSPSTALQTAMRERLLAHAPLLALLGGGHVFEEIPRGAQEPYVVFASAETRDWSVQGQKAHEHFMAIDVKTKSRSRKLAQDIVHEIESSLDEANFPLAGHALINLRLTFWSLARDKAQEHFNATLRFRAATEPL
jgi:Protein of unknown function (DUF3168)